MEKRFLILNITTVVKFVQFYLFCPVNLSCFYYFSFLVFSQQFSKKMIIIGLFWLLTLLVLSKHCYLIYKNKQK